MRYAALQRAALVDGSLLARVWQLGIFPFLHTIHFCARFRPYSRSVECVAFDLAIPFCALLALRWPLLLLACRKYGGVQ